MFHCVQQAQTEKEDAKFKSLLTRPSSISSNLDYYNKLRLLCQLAYDNFRAFSFPVIYLHLDTRV